MSTVDNCGIWIHQILNTYSLFFICKKSFGTANSLFSCMRFHDWILRMYVFVLYIMCLIIFEEKAEVQDQYILSLNLVQKANDPILDRYRSIWPLITAFRVTILTTLAHSWWHDTMANNIVSYTYHKSVRSSKGQIHLSSTLIDYFVQLF